MGNPKIRKGPFELQIHLRGMRSEDALEVVLPAEYARLRIGELIESVFPEDEGGRSQVEDMFDLRENPDLPEIYAALVDVFGEWRTRRCALRFTVNHGSEVELSDLTAEWLTVTCPKQDDPGRPTLSLAVAQEYPSLEHAIEEGYWDDKGELMEWLQSQTLLYFIDKHDFKLSAAPSQEMEQQLLPIAEALRANQILSISEGTGYFDITRHGRRFIGSQIAETESYINRYDIFKDVDYDVDALAVEFGTDHGEDLRVQVFISEGLDPVRVVFLLRLYDGTLDEFIPSWGCQIHDMKFYDEILEPLMNRQRADDGLIERIIESGYTYIDERAEEKRELLSSQEILHKATAKSSLSSDGEEKDE